MKQSGIAAAVNKTISAIILFTLVICFVFPAAAFSQTTLEWMVLTRGRTTGEQNALAKYKPEDIEELKRISLEHLKNRALQRGLISADDFAIQKIEVDELEMIHTRVSQMLDGIPVWGGEAIVHLKADESLFAITDGMKEIDGIGTKPNFSEKDAVEFAKESYQGSKFLTEEPKIDLWIFPGEYRTHLAYRVQMRREDGSADTAMPVIFIDAHTGEKIFEYDNLQTGSGSSLYSGTVSISTSQVGSTFYLEDLTRKTGTFDSRNTTSAFYRYTDTDDIWNSTSQRAAVDAQFGAVKTFDYFKTIHGRNGIDGNGGPGTQTAAANSAVKLITSRVHYSTNYNNAYWNGTTMTYGDGDGRTFSPLPALDICAHEMTHGITERTAKLIYSGESGALNESMSDVFAAMVEIYVRGENANTWKIGEDAYTPSVSGDALRYMNEPHSAVNNGFTLDDDHDHYSERYTGTADNGGVHINSSIGNKAFYLVAKGGTHHKGGSMNGIGTDAAAKIWYKALTTYMTSGTNFAGARTATLNAASAIYGSTSAQYNAVAQAWCLVGVGSTCTPPTPTGTELLTNGGFEMSASPWVGSGTGYFYIANGTTPHGGTGYIYFGVNNSVSGQSYQQVSIPTSATGNLTFWLNISSNETTTTTQYDKLFVEVRNASGTLLATLATYSNLNKGTAYTQKTFNLAAYKGQTVRLQFRSTTDTSQITTFRVDDVSLK